MQVRPIMNSTPNFNFKGFITIKSCSQTDNASRMPIQRDCKENMSEVTLNTRSIIATEKRKDGTGILAGQYSYFVKGLDKSQLEEKLKDARNGDDGIVIDLCANKD